jgi:hypothetical protein
MLTLASAATEATVAECWFVRPAMPDMPSAVVCNSVVDEATNPTICPTLPSKDIINSLSRPARASLMAKPSSMSPTVSATNNCSVQPITDCVSSWIAVHSTLALFATHAAAVDIALPSFSIRPLTIRSGSEPSWAAC